MTLSNSNSNKTGIKVASYLPPEIQSIILKFIIVDFVYFIDEIFHNERYNTPIECSKNIQAQLLSMTGYDDLLDDIICMALEELELTFDLRSRDPLFIDDFINFVTSRSVRLKGVGLWRLASFFDNSVITERNTLKLLDLHSDKISLKWDISPSKSVTDCPPLKFVSFISCPTSELSLFLDSDLLNKLTSWTKFSVELVRMSDLSVLEGMMEHLQLGVPSLKHLYLNWRRTQEAVYKI
ncbi:unnamed protein product [Ambrosiozyma monospora]|uniref:Unnamed protein product n=1 Tax=Ambrosiozyma monospora TaxID=43982 RepID=A0A9W7DGC5_AMBMO|nr:unnamed protein product [Ambrosiozyma monospora]